MRRDSTDGRAGALCPWTCEVTGLNPAQGILLREKEFELKRQTINANTIKFSNILNSVDSVLVHYELERQTINANTIQFSNILTIFDILLRLSDHNKKGTNMNNIILFALMCNNSN